MTLPKFPDFVTFLATPQFSSFRSNFPPKLNWWDRGMLFSLQSTGLLSSGGSFVAAVYFSIRSFLGNFFV